LLRNRCSLVLATFFLFASTLVAQAAPKACPAPPAILNSSQPNIFSEQQEQWLGDAMADQIERFYKPVKDPAENAYLAHIAKRLLAALPSTTIQFRVTLLDSDQVNAFSLAGGRVYLFKKLVINAKNEDEVASVIGHEMGHILSHQFAYETTADLKRLLNITSVGDKADIYAKMQLLIDARMKDKHPSQTGNSDEGQDQADTVSMYGIAAAGYYPQAFSEFWNRMFFVDGKVGGPLSDFFGVTKPQEKRLRGILKLVNALPPGCGASKPSESPEFQKWQALVAANQPASSDHSASVSLNRKPVAEVALNPPLRMSLERLRFSRDGKYVLAQDESSIFVLSRDPYKQIFRFDAEQALPAEFSPDSQHIVFSTRGLHTEDWSISDQKLLASHDPVTRNRCIQTQLSPDGRTLFCLSVHPEVLPTGQGCQRDGDRLLCTSPLDLTVLDAASGDVLLKKEDFFVPTFGFATALNLVSRLDAPVDLIPSSFSTDGNTILIGPSLSKIAFDLRTRTPIKVSKGLTEDLKGAYAFVGNDKVAGVGRSVGDSGIFSFPDGKRLKAVPFSFANFESASSGNYVLTRDVKDYAVGLVDVDVDKFVIVSKSRAMDVWDGTLLNENADGSVVLHRLGDKSIPDQTTTLPISPLAAALSATISNDGRFIALSSRTRGGVWDLKTGERVLLALHFNNAVFAPDDSVYIEFPKQDKQDRAIVHFAFAPFSATPTPYKEDTAVHLTHSGLQEWKPTEDKKAVELIVHNLTDNSVLWRQTFDEAQFGHTSSVVVPGEILVAFTLKSDFAKARITASAALADQATKIQNRDKGGLLQVLDSASGKVLHEVVLEIPLDYEGLQGIHVIGDLLYLTGRANRTVVYSAATGAQIRQMFGTLIAADPSSGRICVTNRVDEAIVYDTDGKQLADFYMGSPLRFATFQLNNPTPGSRLMILTADQKFSTMEIAATPSIN
jgi:WD40 repeat protein